MDSEGNNLRNLTRNSGGDGSPSWSSDGGSIAFSSTRDGNYEIYVMGRDGSNPRNLTDSDAYDGWPSWSSDGRSIAFSSTRDSNYEIYVMGWDGSNPRNLTDQRALTTVAPSWSSGWWFYRLRLRTRWQL